MKYYKYLITSVAVLCTMLSCDEYLDVMPDNVATIDYAFRDRTGAEKFLSTCYSYIPSIGSLAYDPAIMGSDETWNFPESNGLVNLYSLTGDLGAWYIKHGLQNLSSPYLDSWNGLRYGGKGLYGGIRYCNIFIDNIDKVRVDITEEEKIRWKAEVKFLKAFYHFYLMRMYGPIPLVKENLGVDASPKEVRVFRDTWDDCVDYIVELLDEAAPDLPLNILERTNEMGRITRPAALGLKAMILATSASPLFNGNQDYADVIDKRGVHIFSTTYDASKWKLAADACKDAIESAHEAGHALYKYTGYYKLSDEMLFLNSLRCVYTDRFNEEIIFSSTNYNATQGYQFYTKAFLKQTDHSQVPNEPYLVPTFSIVEKFYTENGVPINEDISFDYENRYSVAAVPKDKPLYYQPGVRTAQLNIGREPRFYANIAFDGGYWWGNGTYTEPGAKINSKQGEISGKQTNLRFSETGYYMKKPVHIETIQSGTANYLSYKNYGAPIIRLSSLYLLYAECLNEAEGPSEKAYEYLDKVRAHAGLAGVVESWAEWSIYPDKPKTKEGLREIIQRERDIELCFESQHFWDVRRWKKAVAEVSGPVKAWTINASSEDEYYQIRTIDNLKFSAKDYLWPIRQQDLRVNTNLIQNPYWE